MAPHLPALTATIFTLVSAVDIWDSTFRWRERAQLHDLTIDHTWARVSDWLAGAEPAAASSWAQRFAAAFANWQLLPDESVLQLAGTGQPLRFDQAPLAVVNAAACVRSNAQGAAWFDHAASAAAATLGVRMLDNALLMAEGPAPHAGRIGLIGMADAFGQLGIAFHSTSAQNCAAEVARSLLHGSLQGAVELTRERGGARPVPAPQLARWREAGANPELLDTVARSGLRATPIIGLFSAPRLAQLANGMSEGSDPVHASTQPSCQPSEGEASGATDAASNVGALHLSAQLQLRATMAPWLTPPIDQPLLADHPPSHEHWLHTVALAARLGLPEPQWRRLERETDAANLRRD